MEVVRAGGERIMSGSGILGKGGEGGERIMRGEWDLVGECWREGGRGGEVVGRGGWVVLV